MEALDLIPDSYAAEMAIAVVAERLYSKFMKYWQDRHTKEDEEKVQTRLDEIAEKLAELKGKQEGVLEWIKKH